jgi:hypothetical protein
LIVGTHGRGFWLIDDITPLRQLTDAVARADAHLFKPGEYTNFVQGGDNGTPLQKDEPQSVNPPNGAAIDYYLRANVSGMVTLDILDGTGAVVRSFSSASADSAPQGGRGGRGGGIANVSPLWQGAPSEPLATTAGLHRVIWNPVAAATPGGRGGRGGGGGGFGRGGAAPLSGTFTARLTVNGQTYNQTFLVRSDPRIR